MECHEDQSRLCPIQNWCVCQWAFASYIEMAGGCHHIQNIQCDAVNQHALLAYKKSSRVKDKNALKCIERKCGLS